MSLQQFPQVKPGRIRIRSDSSGFGSGFDSFQLDKAVCSLPVRAAQPTFENRKEEGGRLGKDDYGCIFKGGKADPFDFGKGLENVLFLFLRGLTRMDVITHTKTVDFLALKLLKMCEEGRLSNSVEEV